MTDEEGATLERLNGLLTTSIEQERKKYQPMVEAEVRGRLTPRRAAASAPAPAAAAGSAAVTALSSKAADEFCSLGMAL